MKQNKENRIYNNGMLYNNGLEKNGVESPNSGEQKCTGISKLMNNAGSSKVNN
jgi:hypothetical protein